MERLPVRMKHLFWALLLDFAIVAVAALPNVSLAASVAATVIKTKGAVFVNRDGHRDSLVDSDKLFESDIVETGPGGRVKLKLTEGSNEVVLGGDTSLKIEKVGQKDKSSKGTVLGLNKGSVRSNVKIKYSGQGEDVYQVRTPNAVAGVRGTVFMVSFSPSDQKSLIATERGAVAWKSPGREMLVAKGMFASVSGNKMSALQSIKSSPEVLKKVNEVRRDAGENALPAQDLPNEASPSSAKNESNDIQKNSDRPSSRSEIDSDGNVIVVVDEQQKDSSLGGRVPASADTEQAVGDVGALKASSATSGGGRPLLPSQLPTVKADFINQAEVQKNQLVRDLVVPGGTLKPPGGIVDSKNRIDALRNVANDTTNAPIIKPPVDAKFRFVIGPGGATDGGVVGGSGGLDRNVIPPPAGTQ